MKKRPIRTSPLYRPSLLALGVAGLLASLTDCGGTAIIDPPDGAGGDGGEGEIVTVSSSTTTTTTTSTTSTSTTTSTTSTGGAPPIPPLVDNDMGTVGVGEITSLDMPEGAVGITAYAQAPNHLDSIGIQTVTAPDMVNLVDGFGIAGTGASYLRFGVQSVAVPQTDDLQAMPLLGGQWNFVVGSQDALPSADVKIWYRQTLDGEFHGGAIDVNVFRVAGVGSDAYLTQLVTSALDGVAGLTVGTINLFPLGDEYSVVTENNYVPLQLETTGAPGKPVVNLMAVEMIDIGSSMNQILGFSPGTPGLPLENGTMQSALVMMITGDSSYDRVVLRHEAGHFAGLLHTSEVELGLTDKLSDTPTCSDPQNLFNSCPDFDNLMFPFANPDGMLLTPQQIEVLRASAIYRGAVEPGGGFAAPLDQDVMGIAKPPDDEDDGSARASSRLAEAAGATAAAVTGGWRQALSSDTVASFLGSVWCGTGASGSSYTMLQQLGAQPDELIAVGLDPSVPAHVRFRALAAAGRLTPSLAGLERLVDLAADTRQPRLVRIGALDGLSVAAPNRLASLGLVGDVDPVVATVAARR